MSRYAVGIALLLAAGPALAEFKPTAPSPVEFPYSLTCGILQMTPSEREDDPVHAIVVKPAFKDGESKQVLSGLDVVHVTAFGRRFSRSDQYSNELLEQTPGRLEITWRGSWRRNPSIKMTGRVWYAADRGRWFYGEQQTKDGRQEMQMLAGCHPTEPPDL